MLPGVPASPRAPAPTQACGQRKHRGAPQSRKSSGPGLGGSCLLSGSGPSSRRLRLGSWRPRPAGPPLTQGLPGLVPAHPAQSHASRPGRSPLRGSVVCLGKADGRGHPLLAASVSWAGTGSSLTSAFAQEGDTQYVTRANEKQRERPAQLHGPAGSCGGSSGGLPAPWRLSAGNHGLLFLGLCLTLLGLKGRVTLTPGLPTERGLPKR